MSRGVPRCGRAAPCDRDTFSAAGPRVRKRAARIALQLVFPRASLLVRYEYSRTEFPFSIEHHPSADMVSAACVARRRYEK
jgi:hypothetical protein